MITLEIATGMIVTLIETAMGAMTGTEIGIGEIATAAIGIVIGSTFANGKLETLNCVDRESGPAASFER